MSICTLEIIKSRLEVAEEHSPLSIFRTYKDGEVGLDCVFNTIETKARIASGDIGYVGTYTKHTNIFKVQEELRRAIY